jgi:high-affinity iron transporter
VHEILENAIQFELTGQTDEGSHTNLATARANVDGSRTALDAVVPLLEVHSPQLIKTARADFDRLDSLLDAFHRPDGSWAPLSSLSTAQHQRLDAAFGQTVEDLSTIPDVLEVPKNDSD